MRRAAATIVVVPSLFLGACCCQNAPAEDARAATPARAASDPGTMTPAAAPPESATLAGPKATPATGGTAVVNEFCVINVDHPVQGGVQNARYTADYKGGQRVGFCCEDCMDAWKAMSPAEKDKAVAEAIAAGRKM